MTAPQLTRYVQGQASVSGDNLNTFEQTCTNVAQLRQLTGTDGMQVFVRGFVTPNDGGAGPFYWSPTATGPDNGTSVIVPIGSSIGAWLRIPLIASSAGSFPTTAALLAAFGSNTTLANGIVFITAGRDTLGDTGGGDFYYDAADLVSLDDGGTIRVDTAGRRWKALVGSALINAGLFGVFQTNPDNSAALNAALAAASRLYTRDVQLGSGVYLCNSTITFDISRTSIDFNGATLDFNNLVASPAIAPFTTETDPNNQMNVHGAHPVRNGKIAGPTNAKICFQPIPLNISGTPWLVGCVYEKLGISGFDVGFVCGDGQPFLTFRDVHFGSSSVRGSNCFFQITGSINTGENTMFDHCTAINCTAFVIDSAGSANFDIYCVSCSADGIRYICTGGSPSAPGGAGFGARMVWLGGHWEPVLFDNYLVFAGGNASFNAYGVEFVVSQQPSHVLFRSDATGVTEGIVLDRINFGSSFNWHNTKFCDGVGNFEISSYGNGNTFLVNNGEHNNRVPKNTFPTSVGVTSTWGGTFVYDTTSPPPGATGDIAMNQFSPNCNFVTSCLPGQKAAAAYQMQIIGFGAGDQIVVDLHYRDKGGNNLGNNTQVFTASQPYLQETIVIFALAPAGTVDAIFSITYVPSFGGATVFMGLPYVIID